MKQLEITINNETGLHARPAKTLVNLVKQFNSNVVIWNGDPFSVYTRAERVYIDGALAYELGNDEVNPVTDFTLGTAASAGGAQ